MGVHSSIPVVKAQLVTRLTTVLAIAGVDGGQVEVSYAWPGPNTKAESVFLGRHPHLHDITTTARHEVPNIKAGRKQRQETYPVDITFWSFRPDLTAVDAQIAEERAFVLFGYLEDLLADDVLIGLPDSTLQSATLNTPTATLHPFGKGWAAEVLATVDIAARLT